MIRAYGNYTSLGQQGGLVLLLSICSSKEPVTYNELRRHVGSMTAVSGFLDAAEDDGLIDIEVMNTPRRKFLITPTAMGKEVGTMLSLINSLVAPGKDTKDKSINMRYAETVLREILAHEPMKQCELLEVVTVHRKLTELTDALEEEGLITVKQDDSHATGRPAHLYFLTPLGRTVADAYRTIFEKIDARRPRMEDAGPRAS